jgi:hypothetical protein
MKVLKQFAGLALLLIVGAGCQKTTSTGPGEVKSNGTTTVKRLTLIAAKNQTIKRGDTDKVLVTVTRDNFDDAVTVRLNDLPKGVELVGDNEAVIPRGSNSVTLELKASDDAEVGEHDVTIAADAPGISENTQTFKLMVKDKS